VIFSIIKLNMSSSIWRGSRRCWRATCQQ